MPTLDEIRAKRNAQKTIAQSILVKQTQTDNPTINNGLSGGNTNIDSAIGASESQYTRDNTSNVNPTVGEQLLDNSIQITDSQKSSENTDNPIQESQENRDSTITHILPTVYIENNDEAGTVCAISLNDNKDKDISQPATAGAASIIDDVDDNILVTKESNINPDKLKNLDALIQAEINSDQDADIDDSVIITQTDDDTELSITAILAKEFHSTEEDIELFQKVYIKVGNSVTSLTIRELEERIESSRRAIKIIEALQQACIRVKGDKLAKETSEQKLKRLEEDKKYKPKARPKMNADGTVKDSLPGAKQSGREKLIAKFMKSGMTRARAEQLLDED